MKSLLIILSSILFLGCDQNSASTNTSIKSDAITPAVTADKDIIVGKLKNIVTDSPLPLLGGLQGSSCKNSDDGLVLYLSAGTTNIECTVTFPKSFEAKGEEVCSLAKSGRLDGAVCRAKESYSLASLNLIYDGSNFSFIKSPEIAIPATCPDLGGKWAYAGVDRVFSWDNTITPSSPVTSITQEGCRKMTIVTGPKDTSFFKAGQFINDGIPSNSDGDWSYFDKNGAWKLMKKNGNWGSKALTGVTTYGRPYLTMEYARKDGSFSSGEEMYLKVQDFIQFGPCWSLTPKDLIPGAICTTTKGYQWLRVSDGWKDLASDGLIWLDFDTWQQNDYKRAVEMCKAKNAFLPSSYIKGASVYRYIDRLVLTKPNNYTNPLISFPDVDGEFAVATQHGLQEVFADEYIQNHYFWSSVAFEDGPYKYASLYRYDVIYGGETGNAGVNYFGDQGYSNFVRCVRH